VKALGKVTPREDLWLKIRKELMILNEYIDILVDKNNLRFYRRTHPNCQVGDILNIYYTQLGKYSLKPIKLKCDYCGEEFERELQIFFRKYNGIIEGQKDACEKCKILKMQETCIMKYGVNHYGKTEEGRKKSSEHIYMKDPIKKEKYKKDMLERYGVENQFQRQEIKNKSKDTIFNKYGVNHIMHLSEYKDKVVVKSKQTMYKNGTAPCSSQQKYIHSLIGGELNYPVDKLSLDIAYPEDKIYIEYNGGGHDFDVKIGRLTEKEFKIKENKRYFFLKQLGWKQICINNPDDNLPSDDIIIAKINESMDNLKNNNINHCFIYF
jgi:hypothetical protein